MTRYDRTGQPEIEALGASSRAGLRVGGGPPRRRAFELLWRLRQDSGELDPLPGWAVESRDYRAHREHRGGRDQRGRFARRRVACLAAGLALTLSGCATDLGKDGEWLSAEWGGSEVTTTTADRRVTTYPDGRVVEELNISEERAVAHGLSENLKGLAVGVIGFLLGGA